MQPVGYFSDLDYLHRFQLSESDFVKTAHIPSSNCPSIAYSVEPPNSHSLLSKAANKAWAALQPSDKTDPTCPVLKSQSIGRSSGLLSLGWRCFYSQLFGDKQKPNRSVSYAAQGSLHWLDAKCGFEQLIVLWSFAHVDKGCCARRIGLAASTYSKQTWGCCRFIALAGVDFKFR